MNVRRVLTACTSELMIAAVPSTVSRRSVKARQCERPSRLRMSLVSFVDLSVTSVLQMNVLDSRSVSCGRKMISVKNG